MSDLEDMAQGSARWTEPAESTPLEPDPSDDGAIETLADEGDIERRGAELLGDRRRIAGLALAVVLLVVAIYFVVPKVVGIHGMLDRVGSANVYWVAAAVGFNVIAFLAYAVLFRRVFGEGTDDALMRRRLDLRASYEISMAGFAATKVFSAAGAGGVALTYWALRRAGMPRQRAAARMVAFLVLLYAVYMLALILFGVVLRVHALPGEAPVGGTIVPAAIAFVVLLVFGLVSLIPGDLGRRMDAVGARPSRWSRAVSRLARGPATVATGTRTALDHLRHPRRSAITLLAAIGWWAGNIGILWASFQAFGVEVPFAVIVQGFFLGMVANLAPSPAGGVGTVDAGMIGAFVLFGIPAATVFPAVLVFRLVSFWLPIPVGIWAYVQLRRTVHGWAREADRATIQSEVIAEAM